MVRWGETSCATWSCEADKSTCGKRFAQFVALFFQSARHCSSRWRIRSDAEASTHPIRAGTRASGVNRASVSDSSSRFASELDSCAAACPARRGAVRTCDNAGGSRRQRGATARGSITGSADAALHDGPHKLAHPPLQVATREGTLDQASTRVVFGIDHQQDRSDGAHAPRGVEGLEGIFLPRSGAPDRRAKRRERGFGFRLHRLNSRSPPPARSCAFARGERRRAGSADGLAGRASERSFRPPATVRPERPLHGPGHSTGHP